MYTYIHTMCTYYHTYYDNMYEHMCEYIKKCSTRKNTYVYDMNVYIHRKTKS